MRNVELKDVLGVSPNAVFMKLRGDSPWKAAEVEAVAEFFDVSVGDLYSGLGLFGDAKSPRRDRDGGSNIGCAIRDSNPGPAD